MKPTVTLQMAQEVVAVIKSNFRVDAELYYNYFGSRSELNEHSFGIMINDYLNRSKIDPKMIVGFAVSRVLENAPADSPWHRVYHDQQLQDYLPFARSDIIGNDPIFY